MCSHDLARNVQSQSHIAEFAFALRIRTPGKRVKNRSDKRVRNGRSAILDGDLYCVHVATEQYYQALKLRNIDTLMVRIPEASHGGMVARPSNLIAKVDNILAWFDRYRKK